jgi:hypothetical protein
VISLDFAAPDLCERVEAALERQNSRHEATLLAEREVARAAQSELKYGRVEPRGFSLRRVMGWM